MFRFWPIIFYCIVLWCNTDIIIPTFLLMGISKKIMLFTIPLLATIELWYQFFFWGWLVSMIGELESFRKARKELKKEGFLDRWVLDGIIRVYGNVINPENCTRRRIKKYGILAVWTAGLNPIPGLPTRGPCAAFLGVFKSKKEFIHLVFANLIHVMYMIYALNWILDR